MSQFPYVPGDSRLVDHIIGELKSKGIFDQFRKECIADVDTRPAYQNLRLRVEGSVTGFLSRQRWGPDLNKNQLREKLRKHIHEANYLEQGVERIVDQVVNPKVASVFVPQVEDLVYSYLGIQRPKFTQDATDVYQNPNPYFATENLLPTDLEAVSPDSVKSQEVEQRDEKMEVSEPEKPAEDSKMDVDSFQSKLENDEDLESPAFEPIIKDDAEVKQDEAFSSTTDLVSSVVSGVESNDTPEKITHTPEENKDEVIEQVVTTEFSNLSIDIPLPNEPPKTEIIQEESIQTEFKASDAESSSDSTIMRNVSPLTPIRSFNNENSCDAQPAFDERKSALEIAESEKTVIDNPIPISTFRFTIESDSNEAVDAKPNKLVNVERSISYQFSNQIDMNNYGAPTYDDSSSSNNLHIDYQSDNNGTTVDSKTDQDTKTEASTVVQQDERSKSKEQSYEEKKKNHKSSHSSKDSHRHSSSRHKKDRRSDSKQPSTSSEKKDSSKSEKKPSKDETPHSSKSRHSSHRDKSKDRTDREISKDKSDKDKPKDEKKDKEKSDKDRHSSSHKSSTGSSNRDSKSKHHSSSSSRRHSSSSSKHSEEKKSSSIGKDRRDDKKDDSKEHRGTTKISTHDHSRQSSSHRSDRDKSKSSSSKEKHDKGSKKDDKKDKKVTDDHYSASGRGNRTRRSTDRDSNDGNSSSSKGSTFMSGVKTANTTTTDNKSSSSKSENQSSGSDSTGQSDPVEQCCDNESTLNENVDTNKSLKPVIQLDGQLKTPVVEVPKLPPVEVKVRKPMIAANMSEAIKFMKIRKHMAAELEKKRQEAALLIEFQEKIHSSVSQVFSGISGPELEFACITKYSSSDKKCIEDNIDDITEVNGEVEIEKEEVMEKEDVIEKVEVIEKEEVIEKPIVEENNVTDIVTAAADDADVADLVVIIEAEDDSNNTIEEKESETVWENPSDDDYLNFMYGDPNKEMELSFFSQQEIFNAELLRDNFAKIYNSLEKVDTNKKIFLLHCDPVEEDLFRQVCQEMGDYTVVNYCRGQLPTSGPNKLNTQDLEMSNELSLPAAVSRIRATEETNLYSQDDSLSNTSYVFSPNLSSDCSLDLNIEYEKKIDELMLKTSRQEVMEIILGGVSSESPNKMPIIVFGGHSAQEEPSPQVNLKRKRNGLTSEIGGTENNNHKVLTPNKIRKLSLSEQITSTTESETNHTASPATNCKPKLTGRARRVGLPKPKSAPTIPMSPSSDKSVENYVQYSCTYSQNRKDTPKLNGTIAAAKTQTASTNKTLRRTKMLQRYDTSDLYKPKFNNLSKRHSNVI